MGRRPCAGRERRRANGPEARRGAPRLDRGTRHARRAGRGRGRAAGAVPERPARARGPRPAAAGGDRALRAPARPPPGGGKLRDRTARRGRRPLPGTSGGDTKVGGRRYRAASVRVLRTSRPTELGALLPRSLVDSSGGRRRRILYAVLATLATVALLVALFAELAPRRRRDRRRGPGRRSVPIRGNDSRDALAFVGEALAATHDPEALLPVITGLANRRRFMEVLTLELKRAERFESPLALLLADLDDFKLVNDRFGHHTGDEALRALSGVFRAGLRDVDLAARLGGEEFAVLLPETDEAGAAGVAERLRAGLERLEIEGPSGASLSLTASFGVAVYPEARTSDELLTTADAALYRAKADGKNRVALAPATR